MQYFVYILSNWNDSVVYTGVTNNLYRRLFEHQSKAIDGFTKKYNICKLVYFETTSDIKAAIEREKQIKSWTRKRKNDLIATMNPNWEDLSKTWE